MLFENLRADFYDMAKWNTSPTFWGKLQLIFDSGMDAMTTYRMGSFATYLKIPIIRQILLFINYLMNVFVHLTSGIDISRKAKIGKGLVIHSSYTGVLISHATMGEYCVLAPNVFIVGKNGGLPKIGNHVFFGIGSKVLGKVNTGDNVNINIGANAVVLKDVPANHAVVGVYPQKIYPNKINTKEKMGVV